MTFILGKEFKDAIDSHTRQNITNKQLADMVISDRRKIQPYKIQDKFYVWRDNKAVHHIIKELVSNSIDEFLGGYGKEIEITLNEKTNTVTVRDWGRGVPLGKLEDVFTKVHTSGKFKGGETPSAYGASGGLNG